MVGFIPWVIIISLAIATLIMCLFIVYISIRAYKLAKAKRRRHQRQDTKPSGESGKLLADRIRKDTNILILGEIGVGKSTLINSIANYIKYNNFREVCEGGVRVVIKAKFVSVIDVDNIREDVQDVTEYEQTSSASGNYRDDSAAVVSYIFEEQSQQDKSLKLRIIDTPGIGNLRGILNYPLPNILSSILGKYDQLDAICICLKPDENVLNMQLSYILDELLSCLHKSAQRSLMFCFTSTRGESIHKLPTVDTLRRFFEERGINITLDHTNLFSFDNIAFKYFCLKEKHREDFSNEDIERNRILWDYSRHEFLLMCSAIRSQRVYPHQIQRTYDLNQIRAAIPPTFYQSIFDVWADENRKRSEFITEIEENISNISHENIPLARHKRTDSFEKANGMPILHKAIECINAAKKFIEDNAILSYNQTAQKYYSMMNSHGDAISNIDSSTKAILQSMIVANRIHEYLQGDDFTIHHERFEITNSSENNRVERSASQVLDLINETKKLLEYNGYLSREDTAQDGVGAQNTISMAKIYIKKKNASIKTLL